MTLRITRPCGRCEHEAACTPFLEALRMLVADHDQRTQHPLPDVCVKCLLFLPRLGDRGHRKLGCALVASV